MIELLKKMNNFIQTELKKDLSITGKEYMELAGINKEDFEEYEDEYGYCYDYVNIEIDSKYVNKLKEKFDSFNEVLWYKSKDDEEEKYYEEGLDVIHNDCKWILTDIYKEGELSPYNISLKEIVSQLTDICCENDEINLTLDYLYDVYVYINITNKGIKNVKFEIDKITSLSKEEETLLLFQLLIISYNVPLKETLEMLKLYIK